MEHYAGIDVSHLKRQCLLFVEAGGRIVREAKVAVSRTLIARFGRLAVEVSRIGLDNRSCRSGFMRACGRAGFGVRHDFNTIK